MVRVVSTRRREAPQRWNIQEKQMKRILLATVAAAALSFPALAQSNDQMQQPQQNETDQSQMQNGGQSANPEATQGSQTNGASEQQASENINPQDLSTDQVKQIQQALGTKRDGIWGPNTASALRKFQEKHNIQASGELNQQTLSQLGVNWSGNNQPQTTGSGQKSNEPMNTNENSKANGNENSTQMDKSGTSGSGSNMNSNDTNEKPADQNGNSSKSGTNGMNQSGTSGAGQNGSGQTDQSNGNK
jgi:hypothetical protein